MMTKDMKLGGPRRPPAKPTPLWGSPCTARAPVRVVCGKDQARALSPPVRVCVGMVGRGGGGGFRACSVSRARALLRLVVACGGGGVPRRVPLQGGGHGPASGRPAASASLPVPHLRLWASGSGCWSGGCRRAAALLAPGLFCAFSGRPALRRHAGQGQRFETPGSYGQWNTSATRGCGPGLAAAG